MSSTIPGTRGGGGVDSFPTPPWATQRLLERVNLPGGKWLEPCAGSGQIISAVNDVRGDVDWAAMELEARHFDALSKVAPVRKHGDFFELSSQLPPLSFDAVITNPPYALAFEFLQRCRELAPWVCMLLRVGFLEGGASPATAGRRAFLERDTPDVYVLPNRPPFARNKKGKWATDSATYAWLVWGPSLRSHGVFELLAMTPREVRSAWLKSLGDGS